jgi:hypothetical protein
MGADFRIGFVPHWLWRAFPDSSGTALCILTWLALHAVSSVWYRSLSSRALSSNHTLVAESSVFHRAATPRARLANPSLGFVSSGLAGDKLTLSGAAAPMAHSTESFSESKRALSYLKKMLYALNGCLGLRVRSNTVQGNRRFVRRRSFLSADWRCEIKTYLPTGLRHFRLLLSVVRGLGAFFMAPFLARKSC